MLFRAPAARNNRNVRNLPGRLLREIARVGGRVFYVGLQKTASPAEHRVNGLYSGMLRESIRRLDRFCAAQGGPQARFFLALDEYSGHWDAATEKGCTVDLDTRCPTICKRGTTTSLLTMEHGFCGLRCTVLNRKERRTYSDLIAD